MTAIEINQGTLLFGNSRTIVFNIIIIVAGILGGILMVALWRLGLTAVGAMFGFFISVWILSLITNAPAITQGVGRIIFISVFALIFGIAIHFLERPILIIGTAFPGAYELFFGIDMFTRVGFAASTIKFLGGGGFTTPVTVGVYGFLGGVAALGVIGTAVQVLFSSRNKYKNRQHYKNIDTQSGVAAKV